MEAILPTLAFACIIADLHFCEMKIRNGGVDGDGLHMIARPLANRQTSNRRRSPPLISVPTVHRHRRNHRRLLVEVLELGSGTGMFGLALALRGARVTLTEMGKELEMLRGHAASNTATMSAGGRVAPVACELQWGVSDLDAWDVEHAERGGRGFDLIVGSDLCICAQWSDALVATLVHFATRHRAASTTAAFATTATVPPPLPIIIGSRRTREGFRHLVDGARAAGFDVSELPLAWMHPDFRSDEIAVVLLQLGATEAASATVPTGCCSPGWVPAVAIAGRNEWLARAAAARRAAEARTGRAPLIVRGFYSSLTGGVTTDALLAAVPIDDHLAHRGHAVFDTASLAEGASSSLFRSPLPSSSFQQHRLSLD